jgi:hypothetical protein
MGFRDDARFHFMNALHKQALGSLAILAGFITGLLNVLPGLTSENSFLAIAYLIGVLSVVAFIKIRVEKRFLGNLPALLVVAAAQGFLIAWCTMATFKLVGSLLENLK